MYLAIGRQLPKGGWHPKSGGHPLASCLSEEGGSFSTFQVICAKVNPNYVEFAWKK